jgi:hypothetical protein
MNYCDTCKQIAQDEVDFLKGLLPKEKKTTDTLYGESKLTAVKYWVDTMSSIMETMTGSPTHTIAGDIYPIVDKVDSVDKITLKEAIDLSIKKWELAVKNGGDLKYNEMVKVIPEIENKMGGQSCGLCHYYNDRCRDCILYKHGRDCILYKHGSACHPFYESWNGSAGDDKLEYAVKLLNVIYQLKDHYKTGRYDDIEKGHA